LALQNKTVLPQQSFGQLLCARKLLSEAQLQQVLEEQKHRPGVHLGSLLIENGEVSEDAVQSTLAYKLGLPFVKLDTFDIDPTALGYLPRELAVKYQLIPLFLHDGHLVVAIANPTDTDVISMVEFVAHLNIEITVACATDILKSIDKHYGDRDTYPPRKQPCRKPRAGHVWSTYSQFRQDPLRSTERKCINPAPNA